MIPENTRFPLENNSISVDFFPIPHDVRPVHEKLWYLINQKNISIGQCMIILNAEKLLLETMESLPKRKDGSHPATHSLEVAEILLSEMNGSPTSIIKALLHDTLEDGDEHITIDTISEQFGDHIANSIDGLTKVRSRNKEEEDIQTLFKIFDRLIDSPEDIAVKLADRLHYYRTVIDPKTGSYVFSKEKLQDKALETLNLYIPLATGLGFHTIGREIASKAIEALAYAQNQTLSMKYAEKYPIVFQKIQNEIDLLVQEKICIAIESKVRLPSYYDAYKATSGNIKDINEAEIPLYVPLVIPQLTNGKKLSYTQWAGNVYKAVHHLIGQNILSENTVPEITQQLQNKELTVRITDRYHDVPIRYIFIPEDINNQRHVTAFDIDSNTVEILSIAKEKINAIKQMYETLRTYRSDKYTLSDMAYCMSIGGVVKAKIYSGEDSWDAGASHNGTILDILLDTNDDIPFIQHQKISIIDGLGNVAQTALDCRLTPNMHILLTDTEKTPSPLVQWLDWCRMPSTKRKIRDALILKINQSHIHESILNDEASLITQILKLRYRIIEQQF